MGGSPRPRAGCVRAEHDVPLSGEPGDTAAVRSTLDHAVGSDVLTQSVVEFGPGRSLPRDTGDALKVVRVSLPHPPEPNGDEGEREIVRRLADQTAQDATTDRQFRVVA